MKCYLEKYCVGCHLCVQYGQATLVTDDKGYYHPVNGNREWLKKICPASGMWNEHLSNDDLWGKSIGVYLGWSNDPEIRKKASSGGMITTIAYYLISSGQVDAVIHTKEDSSIPYKTVTIISNTREQLLTGAGSRYAISHPLDIISSLEEDKKYALIGKPCDITAMRNLMEQNTELKEKIVVLLSFFCMGLPSESAQKELLSRLRCGDSCSSLTYRGNGWPGSTVALDGNGKEYTLDYNTTWGGILGRDVMPVCKVCSDGIGEAADISCGDAWYLKEDGRPDFSEHEGRNFIFARTQTGSDIIAHMQDRDFITIEPFDDHVEELKKIQTSQFHRRASLRARLAALRIMLQPYPRYFSPALNAYSRHLGLKERMLVFLGTCRRILNGKL